MTDAENLTPFACTSGPKSAKIAIVGEAWGEQEELLRSPFIGTSGQELTAMLREAGITRSECFLTNVLALRPPNNKLESLCGKKAEVGKDYKLPPIKQGSYLLPCFLPHVQRLEQELSTVQPNVTVAMGNLACWALLSATGIASIRGSTAYSKLIPNLKVLPTYHPSGVLRNWAWRPIVVTDLMKALRESETPVIVRPEREVLTKPTLNEIAAWIKRPAYLYAVDIETSRKQITMVGFARSASDALLVPFVDKTKPGNSYWQLSSEELEARRLCNLILAGETPKVLQNGLFDSQYLLREGFRLHNFIHDTMLLSHSLWPELQKGLGFLSSVHTDEFSYKLLRKQEDTKRDS